MSGIAVVAFDDGRRAALAALLVESYGFYDTPSPTPEALEACFDLLSAPGYPRAVMAERDGAALGYAIYARMAPPVPSILFLKELYVGEVARGAGVGRLLMAWLLEEAARCGCARMDWTTDAFNPGALDFYERLGADLRREKRFFHIEAASYDAILGRLAE